MNDYIGVEAVVTYCRANDEDQNGIFFEASAFCSYLSHRERTTGRLSLSVTPFDLDLFGNRFMDFSILFGVHSEYKVALTDQYGYYSDGDYYFDLDVEQELASHVGGAMNFYINKNVSLSGYAKFSDTGDHVQSGMNLGMHW